MVVQGCKFGEVLWQADAKTLATWASKGKLELAAHRTGQALARYLACPTHEDLLVIHKAVVDCHKFTWSV